MGKGKAMRKKFTCGFTLIEMIAVLVILALLGIGGTEMLQSVLGGYLQARSSDEVAQKAQMALNRMTIEFTYLTPGSTSGTGTSLTYGTSGIGQHTISQSGTALLYSEGGQNFILADELADNGLLFQYYDTYDGAASSSFNSATTSIIGVTLIMHGTSWEPGVTKTFSTRVAINKIQ